MVGNKNYAPTKKAYNYFTDIGIGYKAQTIGTTEAKTYILVYDVNNNYVTRLDLPESFDIVHWDIVTADRDYVVTEKTDIGWKAIER